MKTKRPDPEWVDEDNPELTGEELRRSRLAADMLPILIGQKATDTIVGRSRGRPPKDERKVNQTLRIDPDVLDAYRQQGKGWQTHINEVLRQNMPRQK